MIAHARLALLRIGKRQAAARPLRSDGPAWPAPAAVLVIFA